MLVELSERLGPSLDWWLKEPFAFVLWSYCHLQELDRRHGWEHRMHRVENAGFTAIAFHDPSRLDQERRLIIADAAARNLDDAELLTRARSMAAMIESGRVMDDGGLEGLLHNQLS